MLKTNFHPDDCPDRPHLTVQSLARQLLAGKQRLHGFPGQTADT